MTSIQNSWRPSTLGRVLTRSPEWELSISAQRFQLAFGSQKYQGAVLDLGRLQVTPGTFWSGISVPISNARMATLDGIPNATAKEMAQAIAQAIRRVRVAELIQNFDAAMQPVSAWASNAREACKTQLVTKGWVTHEFKQTQSELKPRGLAELLSEPEVVKHLERQPQPLKDAVSLWKSNFTEVADDINARHLAKELLEFKSFFDQVEKSPLTEEQAKAVICFDNRVLLVASAGSGKTSTMVAKAGYALKKGYFEADRILLLAFNKDAAAELRERIKTRLEPLGLPADKVAAKTFHAFGLDIIGAATGKRPSVAPWLESGQDLEMLLELVDELKDRDDAFRTNWDLFRVVFGQDLPKFGKEQDSPDSWDRDRKEAGFWTLNGDVVKSRGEQLIANWMFYNGVKYEYESSYRIDTADAQHRQYRPDFYLPDVDVYLEHWAVDEEGEPPPEFTGYKEGMVWKRQVHATNGTKLLETTMAELWSGKAFRYLTQELTKLGITLDPNPDREGKGRKPIDNPRLARTFRAFLTHAKSNRLSVATLKHRLDVGLAGHFRFRHQMFLELFEKVWTAWEARLKAERCIDFEDMLGLAADCVEFGQWQSPYELVMVDEFQDVSQARARLVASLLKSPGRCLFAVGDDWQSINRFAGADLGVMTDFDEKFGKAVTLKLETTFRCPQSLCDISSSFVQKNPQQLRKKVRSSKPDIEQPIRIIRVNEEAKIKAAIANRIQELADGYATLSKPLRVYVLGRYRKEREHLPIRPTDGRVQLEFVTAHSSKGLEADHVIVPRMTSETLGFPSHIEDDPVLQLAMPGGDSFEDAEERRLFYVALTRARSTVTLITLAHKESPFIAELVKDYQLQVLDLDGEVGASQVCPSCEEGFMVQKTGPYGPFLSCNRFPKCRHKEKIQPSEQHNSVHRGGGRASQRGSAKSR
ncbi:UvrD-helicase domain-containing protein [Noviherbaspirillum sp. UKPF54]|uniref:UvrD-helicase domain-containing protein n=1 Tax=Noviherbaspirillum sp. UKPF54 TaxID=2601898 RepID=UPI0011B14A3D|nr:UvrD-helicase domain-containing protein [Noviherbaspirillum sp. UKPF54]QDZ26570.1 DNA helicase UvrD [Noviherbaspirillum sp. UKPF54]